MHFGLHTQLSGGAWKGRQSLPARSFVCGFCGKQVSSAMGFYAGAFSDGSGNAISWIYICPGCDAPTYYAVNGRQFPREVQGAKLEKLPADLARLFDEAKVSASVGAHTAAVLVCRKLLMNIAVSLGAKEGGSFVSYVEYLAENAYIPPNGKGWVDYIRKRGNEATHEIHLMEEGDATSLLTFMEMLLKIVYEYPAMVPSGGK